MTLMEGAFGIAKLELHRMATSAMSWEEEAMLFRKVPQEAPLEATIKAIQSRLTVRIGVGGWRCTPPRRMAQGRSDLGARAVGAAPDRC
jgi:hypothetical protein